MERMQNKVTKRASNTDEQAFQIFFSKQIKNFHLSVFLYRSEIHRFVRKAQKMSVIIQKYFSNSYCRNQIYALSLHRN